MGTKNELTSSEFLNRCINEINIAKQKQEYSDSCLDVVLELIKTWDKSSLDIVLSQEKEDVIIKLFKTLIDGNPITPINLLDDEVVQGYNNIKFYKRCKSLVVDYKGVYNTNAYKINTKFKYNICAHTRINQECVDYINKVYITKGGVITGEYIEKCYLNKSKEFTHISKVVLDCNIVYDEEINKRVYVIDHRSAKLKALREFYYVPILEDKNIIKYDLRNFNKL